MKGRYITDENACNYKSTSIKSKSTTVQYAIRQQGQSIVTKGLTFGHPIFPFTLAPLTSLPL